MISKRSKLSLCQYLELHDNDFLQVLFEKHGIAIQSEIFLPRNVIGDLSAIIFGASSEQLLSLLEEIIRTSKDLRSQVSPKYRWDARWEDMIHCLQLDGYKIADGNMITIEPSLAGVEPIEDDFSVELKRSGLAEAEEIRNMMEKSAEDFRKTNPDYNGCLTNARIALETLAKAIAKARMASNTETFNEDKWGEVLAYLRKSGFLSDQEEKGIAGVYSFVSDGAHRPVGFSEQEMARLGRSLVAAMCYFLVKVQNQQ